MLGILYLIDFMLSCSALVWNCCVQLPNGICEITLILEKSLMCFPFFFFFFKVVMEELLTELKSNLEFDEKCAEGIKEDRGDLGQS